MNTGLKFSKTLIAWTLVMFNVVLFMLAFILSIQIGFLTALKIAISLGVLLIGVFALVLISNSIYTGIFVFIDGLVRDRKKNVE